MIIQAINGNPFNVVVSMQKIASGMLVLITLLLLMIPPSHASTIVDYEIPNTTCIAVELPGITNTIETYQNHIFLYCQMEGTYGFLKLDPDTNQVEFYKVGQTEVWYKIDNNGDIWFPIIDGIARLNTGTRELTKYYIQKDLHPIDILIENESSVWASFKGGILNLNINTGEVKCYPITPPNPSDTWTEVAYPFRMVERDGQIFMLISARPLDAYSGGLLASFDIASEKFAFYNMSDTSIISDIVTDHLNNIWVIVAGSNVGASIGLLDPDSMKVTYFPLGSPHEISPWFPTLDDEGNLWFGDVDRSQAPYPFAVLRFNKFNPAEKTVTTYQFSRNLSTNFPILDIALDMNRNVWLADPDFSKNVTHVSKLAISEPYVTVSRTCTEVIEMFSTTTGGLWVTSTSTMNYCTRMPETQTLTSTSFSYNTTTYTTQNKTTTTFESQSTFSNLSTTSETFQQTLYSYTVPEFMSPALIAVFACVAVTLLKRRLRTAAPKQSPSKTV